MRIDSASVEAQVALAEVESALMAILILILRDQLKARRDRVVSAERKRIPRAITDVPSRTMALPSALSVAMKYHFLPP